MMRTGLPGKPWGSAADGLAISASAARTTAHANPPAADRPMPCAPSRILARRPDGAISAFTRVDAKENAPPMLGGAGSHPSTSMPTPYPLGASGHDARFPRAAAASKDLLVEVDIMSMRLDAGEPHSCFALWAYARLYMRFCFIPCLFAPERFDEPRQPFCKLIAVGQSQPTLLHVEIILDRRWGQGGFGQPLAFLRTAKALVDVFAEVLEHGAPPKDDRRERDRSLSHRRLSSGCYWPMMNRRYAE